MMLSSLLSTHKQTMGHHRVRSEPSRPPEGTGPEIDLRPPVNFVDAMHTLQWQQQQQHAHHPPPPHPAILGRTFPSQPDPRYQGNPEASTSSLHANVLARSSALNDAIGETHGSPIMPHQALKKSTSSNSVGHAKKEFICQGFGDCRMAFSRQEHLARHVRKHTGEKPFQCHCGKAFSRLDNLRQHANTTHPQLADQNAAMLQNNTTIRKNMTPPKRAKKGSRRSPSLLDQPSLGFSPQSSSSSDAGNNHSLTASHNECTTTACTPNHTPYENYYPSTSSSLYSLPPSDYPTSYSHQMLFPKEEWTPSPTHPTFNDKPIHLPAIDASMWSSQSQSQPQPQPSGSGSWAQAHYLQLHQAPALGSMSAPTSPVLHPPFRRGHFKTESSQF